MTGYSWTCPRCGNPLQENHSGKRLGHTCETYEECRRHCRHCRLGLSNAKRPTFLRENWRDGLWNPDSAARLEEACRNRFHGAGFEDKLRKLSRERSEDLLTWNVFEHLERSGTLDRFWEWATGAKPTGQPVVLYWGWNDQAPHQRLEMEAVFEEHFRFVVPMKRDEPDIIVWANDQLVILEAKFGSPNPRPKNRELYIHAASEAFTAEAMIRPWDFEQLVRNWAIGWRLAASKKGSRWLINLVRDGVEPTVERDFRPMLQEPELFRRLTWEGLATTVAQELIPQLRQVTEYFEPAFPALALRNESGNHIPTSAFLGSYPAIV